jgi:hypothetical protein
MDSIKTEYIIFFWILALVLFTFYCIFRLTYLKKEKYVDTVKTTPNILAYLDSLEQKKLITDIKGCENIFDDNFKVQSLGYSNCQNAYSDYISKGLDVNQDYGQKYNLSEICPVSTKTAKYQDCSRILLEKNTNTANILDSVNVEMETSINKRIRDRISSLDIISDDLRPFVFKNDNIEFITDMINKKQIPQTRNDVLPLVADYYNSKYNGKYDGTKESFEPDISILEVPAELEALFFGKYKSIKGNLKSFNNIIIELKYNINDKGVNNGIILTIDGASFNIIYEVASLKNYKNFSNVIQMKLINRKILKESENGNELINLMNLLGFGDSATILITYSEFISPEKKKRATYKIVNDNLDTLIVLEKE